MEGDSSGPSGHYGDTIAVTVNPHPALNGPRQYPSPYPVPRYPQTALGYAESYNEALERDRHKNDLKLKHRWEHVFVKYGKDFTKVGDEVDIVTGEVLVNNGHLQHMRNAGDLGVGRRSTWDVESSDSEEEESESGGQHDREDNELEDDPVAGQFGAVEEDEHDTSNSEGGSDDDEDSLKGFIDHNEDELAANEDTNIPHSPLDVWNDIPQLPSDSRGLPGFGSANRPGFSNKALRQLEANIAAQISQFMHGSQQAQLTDEDGQAPQPHSNRQPQVKIDMDPCSSTYGQVTFNFGLNSASKRSLPQDDDIITQDEAKRQRLMVDDLGIWTREELAARVAERIAAAGLPSAPGPDGKWAPYKGLDTESRKRPEKVLSGVKHTQQDPEREDNPTDTPTLHYDGPSESSDSLIDPSLRHVADQYSIDEEFPIDPALFADLSAQPVTEIEITETTPKQRESSPDSLQSRYSANTARPLASKADNKKPVAEFSEVDDALILELKEDRRMFFQDIQQLFFPELSVTQLHYRYYQYLKPECHNEFTAQDDEMIVELKETDKLSWEEIQQGYFSEFRITQLQYRYYSELSESRRITWSPEQDEMLRDLKDVRNWTWSDIRETYFPDRSLGQIQYRYYRRIRPHDWKEKLLELTRAAEAIKASRQNGEPGEARAQGHRGVRHEPKAAAADGEEGPNEALWNLYRRLAGSSELLSQAKRQRHADKKRKQEEEAHRKAARKEARWAKKISGKHHKSKGQDQPVMRPKSRDSLDDDDDAVNDRDTQPNAAACAVGQSAASSAENDDTDLEMIDPQLRPPTKAPTKVRKRKEQEPVPIDEAVRRRAEELLLQKASKLGPMLLPNPMQGVMSATSTNSSSQGPTSKAYSSPYACEIPSETDSKGATGKQVGRSTMGKEQPIAQPATAAKRNGPRKKIHDSKPSSVQTVAKPVRSLAFEPAAVSYARVYPAQGTNVMPERLIEAEAHRQNASSALEQLQARGYSIGSRLGTQVPSSFVPQPLPRHLWAAPIPTPFITIRNFDPLASKAGTSVKEQAAPQSAPKAPPVEQHPVQDVPRKPPVGQFPLPMPPVPPIQQTFVQEQPQAPSVQQYPVRVVPRKPPVGRFSRQRLPSQQAFVQVPPRKAHGERFIPRTTMSSQLPPQQLRCDSEETISIRGTPPVTTFPQPPLQQRRYDSKETISLRGTPVNSSSPDNAQGQDESSQTDPDVSGDELTGNKELFDKTVLGMRASLSFVDSRRPRRSMSRTPVKLGTPLTGARARISSLLGGGPEKETDEAADELAL